MIVIPAIDIKNGKCVRLRQGEADQQTVYSEHPVDVARKWVEMGASRLHVIDLDGAFTGRPVNLEIIRQIKKETSAFIQVGGGYRHSPEVREALEAGIDRVILGTVVFTDKTLSGHLFESFGDRLMVAMDVRFGFVAIKGWTDSAGVNVSEALKEIEEFGGKDVIYTDISRDGMMGGANIEAVKNVMAKTTLHVFASGGVTSLSDIEKLRDIGSSGCIVGKALYEGKIDLKDAIARAAVHAG